MRLFMLVCAVLCVGVQTASANPGTPRAAYPTVLSLSSPPGPVTSGPVAVGAVTAHSFRHPATLIRPALASSQVRVTLSFHPRNPGLLTRLAAQSGNRPGIPVATLRHMFAPPDMVIAETTGYLRGYGLVPVGGGFLTRSYAGSVASSQRAFHVSLGVYQLAATVFRAPAQLPTLPAALASQVTAIAGLDTYPLVHPQLSRRVHANAVTPSCSGPAATQAAYPGSLLPADFAASTGYNFQSVLDAGGNGAGNTLALVEFSNYQPSDVATYQSCMGTSVPVTDVPVNGGTTDQSGAGEVALDEEVAATAAPALSHIYTYIAPNNGFYPALDAILNAQSTTSVNLLSISWGECEPGFAFTGAFNAYDLAASEYDFELLAAAGVSTFASSGDSGSTDCQGSNAITVDFPASSPYVTAVGGTTLNPNQSAPTHETTWGWPPTPSGGGGGGGVSTLFPMPTWQTGTGVIESSFSSMSACGQTSRYCREIPDISLDANLDTGYVIYCSSADCGYAGWAPIGGTSAAAPLAAAMTADANTYSVLHGGGKLGYANPMLYQQASANPSTFNDVTQGTNSISGGAEYPAGAGYDMATGLGSLNGVQYANDVAAHTASYPSFQSTTLSSAESTTVAGPGGRVGIGGVLFDTTSGLPLAGREVIINASWAYLGQWHTIAGTVTTNSSGQYLAALTVSPTIGARIQWDATYAGEESIDPQVSALHTIYVRPTLTTTANLPWNGHYYTATHGRAFTLSGAAKPYIAGRYVTVQWRARTSSVWHSTTLRARVGTYGGYALRISFSTTGSEYLRWWYTGSLSGPWVSAAAVGRLFVIR